MSGFSFDDLKPATVNAVITTAYGKTLTIPLQTLSWEQWEAIGRQVPEPEIPKTKPGAKPDEYLPNPQDEVYLKRRSDAANERLMRRVLIAMEGGGTVVPGANIKEKIAALNAIESGVLQAIVGIVAQSNMGAQRRFEELSASFRNGTTNAPETENLPAVGDNA